MQQLLDLLKEIRRKAKDRSLEEKSEQLDMNCTLDSGQSVVFPVTIKR